MSNDLDKVENFDDFELGGYYRLVHNNSMRKEEGYFIGFFIHDDEPYVLMLENLGLRGVRRFCGWQIGGCSIIPDNNGDFTRDYYLKSTEYDRDLDIEHEQQEAKSSLEIVNEIISKNRLQKMKEERV